MGRYIAKKELVPDEAIVSTASRTQETWYLLPVVASKMKLFAVQSHGPMTLPLTRFSVLSVRPNLMSEI